jgi:hypothetical protein
VACPAQEVGVVGTDDAPAEHHARSRRTCRHAVLDRRPPSSAGRAAHIVASTCHIEFPSQVRSECALICASRRRHLTSFAVGRNAGLQLRGPTRQQTYSKRTCHEPSEPRGFGGPRPDHPERTNSVDRVARGPSVARAFASMRRTRARNALASTTWCLAHERGPVCRCRSRLPFTITQRTQGV